MTTLAGFSHLTNDPFNALIGSLGLNLESTCEQYKMADIEREWRYWANSLDKLGGIYCLNSPFPYEVGTQF